MDQANLTQAARAVGLVLVSATLAASCRLTESLDGFTNGEGGASAGGSGASGGDTGGFAGDAGGTGGTGQLDASDGSAGDANQEAGGTGGSVNPDAGDAEPDGPSTACSSGTCNATCKDCDGVSANGCETDITSTNTDCGQCGHSCQGGACVSAACQTYTLTSGLTMPWGIVADEAKVYWVSEGTNNNGSVASVSVTGGQKETLAQGQSSPVYLVADSQFLYWTTFASGGAIWRINKDGTGQNQLSLATGPQGLAGDDADVWWSNASDGSIRHIAKSGGSPQIMVSGLTDPRGIAVDPAGGSVYWTSLSGGEIHKALKDGSQPATLATGEDHPIAIAVDAENVYWADAGTYAAGDCSAANGLIVRANKADGSGRTPIATGQACPLALWIDGGMVYWTNTGTVTAGSYNYDGAVMRWDGTQVQAFESSQIRPYGITTNSGSVFWTEQGIFQNSGAIKKRAK